MRLNKTQQEAIEREFDQINKTSRDSSLLNSNIVLQVAKFIAEQEPTYNSEIARNLDLDKQSVANYLKLLRSFNLIKRSHKEGRKVFYEGSSGLEIYLGERKEIRKAKTNLKDFLIDKVAENREVKD